MESVIEGLRRNRVAVFFVLALLVHISLLWVPVARQAARSVVEAIPVQLRYRHERVTPQAPQIDESPQTDRPPVVTESPTETLESPQPPRAVVPSTPIVSQSSPEELLVPEKPEPAVVDNLARRLLSDQYDSDRALRKPLFSEPEALSRESRDYVMYQSENLDEVLNEPSLQLPFEDTRIYVVDYYDEGFEGSMQRFWDKVTVPFGWTTKNNTRIQCAWVLVFAGCSWGDKRLFHQEAKKRKPESPDGA